MKRTKGGADSFRTHWKQGGPNEAEMEQVCRNAGVWRRGQTNTNRRKENTKKQRSDTTPEGCCTLDVALSQKTSASSSFTIAVLTPGGQGGIGLAHPAPGSLIDSYLWIAPRLEHVGEHSFKLSYRSSSTCYVLFGVCYQVLVLVEYVTCLTTQRTAGYIVTTVLSEKTLSSHKHQL